VVPFEPPSPRGHFGTHLILPIPRVLPWHAKEIARRVEVGLLDRELGLALLRGGGAAGVPDLAGLGVAVAVGSGSGSGSW
jgi:hypothetical protein